MAITLEQGQIEHMFIWTLFIVSVSRSGSYMLRNTLYSHDSEDDSYSEYSPDSGDFDIRPPKRQMALVTDSDSEIKNDACSSRKRSLYKIPCKYDIS